jgi:uncharacterized protein YbjT (DUF2867 family)
MSPAGSATVLLTGATGFVGRHLWPELLRGGYEVRCMSRSAAAAAARWPDRRWVQADLADASSLEGALTGCSAAFYLAHGMAEGGGDFRRREVEQAQRFAAAAGRAGVSRLVYLGGFAPAGPPTEHLSSRLEVGETLRGGPVPTLELRASMIVGHGSLSWLIVRDLAARLPVMVLPRWLRSRTQPVALDDVLVALARGLELPLPGGASYDLPGPDTLTGRAILEETSRALGLAPPRMLEVPVLSPWLSSHWVRFVTRAHWETAREIVVGMASDFVARNADFWDLIDHRPMPFAEAARRALAVEATAGESIGGFWGAVERLRLRAAGRARSHAAE